MRHPDRQIRSHASPIPARPSLPFPSPFLLVNGHAVGPSRASVPVCHVRLGRNVVAVSGHGCQTRRLATRRFLASVWSKSARFGIWCSIPVQPSLGPRSGPASRGSRLRLDSSLPGHPTTCMNGFPYPTPSPTTQACRRYGRCGRGARARSLPFPGSVHALAINPDGAQREQVEPDRVHATVLRTHVRMARTIVAQTPPTFKLRGRARGDARARTEGVVGFGEVDEMPTTNAPRPHRNASAARWSAETQRYPLSCTNGFLHPTGAPTSDE